MSIWNKFRRKYFPRWDEPMTDEEMKEFEEVTEHWNKWFPNWYLPPTSLKSAVRYGCTKRAKQEELKNKQGMNL
jgi:branched-subunit amino acid aminotransferase/4-amino-4-deoxychorismate lyase